MLQLSHDLRQSRARHVVAPRRDAHLPDLCAPHEVTPQVRYSYCFCSGQSKHKLGLFANPESNRDSPRNADTESPSTGTTEGADFGSISMSLQDDINLDSFGISCASLPRSGVCELQPLNPFLQAPVVCLQGFQDLVPRRMLPLTSHSVCRPNRKKGSRGAFRILSLSQVHADS
jgi:hypothetical protein